MNRRRWLRIAIVSAIVIAVLYVAGSFLIEQSVVEYYSRDWASTSTNDAKRRGVFVTAPAVTPAAVAVSNSVEARVTDAWVEYPTHVVYRWHLLRRVVVDSGYRLIVHLVQGPHSGQAAAFQNRECSTSVRFYLDDKPAEWSSDFTTQILRVASHSPFPDTVHLRTKREDPASLPRDAMLTPAPCS